MSVLRRPLQIIRDNLRHFLLLTLMAFGLLLLGMAAGVAFPGLTAARQESLAGDGTTDLVVSLLATPWLFALMIFGVNLTRIALASILLPSLAVPFLGVAVFAWFAVETGVTLAPVDHASRMTLIPHSLTLVLEFGAYVLLMLGAVLLGRAWLRPQTVGATTRRRGYLRGLQQIGWLALPALALFVVGAIWEAFSLARLTPVLLAG